MGIFIQQDVSCSGFWFRTDLFEDPTVWVNALRTGRLSSTHFRSCCLGTGTGDSLCFSRLLLSLPLLRSGICNENENCRLSFPDRLSCCLREDFLSMSIFHGFLGQKKQICAKITLFKNGIDQEQKRDPLTFVGSGKRRAIKINQAPPF